MICSILIYIILSIPTSRYIIGVPSADTFIFNLYYALISTYLIPTSLNVLLPTFYIPTIQDDSRMPLVDISFLEIYILLSTHYIPTNQDNAGRLWIDFLNFYNYLISICSIPTRQDIIGITFIDILIFNLYYALISTYLIPPSQNVWLPTFYIPTIQVNSWLPVLDFFILIIYILIPIHYIPSNHGIAGRHWIGFFLFNLYNFLISIYSIPTCQDIIGIYFVGIFIFNLYYVLISTYHIPPSQDVLLPSPYILTIQDYLRIPSVLIFNLYYFLLSKYSIPTSQNIIGMPLVDVFIFNSYYVSISTQPIPTGQNVTLYYRR